MVSLIETVVEVAIVPPPRLRPHRFIPRFLEVEPAMSRLPDRQTKKQIRRRSAVLALHCTPDHGVGIVKCNSHGFHEQSHGGD